MIPQKFSPFLIVGLVLFYSFIMWLVLFSDKGSEKYIYAALVAVTSWLAIKKVSFKR